MNDFLLTSGEPTESRFTLFRRRIFGAYQQKWGSDPRWGGMEQNQLARLLKEMPKLTLEEFALAVQNALASDDIPEQQRPGLWLPRLESYLKHAHDRFSRKPNGKGQQITDYFENELRLARELDRVRRQNAK
jgi:hypothetical protein